MKLSPIQTKLLELSKNHDLSKMTLRQIGSKVGVDHPQVVKYHLGRLAELKLANYPIPKNARLFTTPRIPIEKDVNLVSVPIYGAVNAGPANLVGEQLPEGYLRVSKTVFGDHREYKSIYALKMVGNSMDNANINNQTIENGDYILINPETKDPWNNNGKYIVSLIDGMANVKKLKYDREQQHIVLLSESKAVNRFPPIVVHREDQSNYLICGQVVKVLKSG